MRSRRSVRTKSSRLWTKGWAMRMLHVAIVAAVLASASGAQAQVYPSHPITMVVPLPAGSAFDVTARLLAERMQPSLGQPVIVENLTGASGSIGTAHVA